MKKRKLARLFAGVLALLTFISYSTNSVTLAEEVIEESAADKITAVDVDEAQDENTQGQSSQADAHTYVYEDAGVYVRATVSEDGILPETATLRASMITSRDELEQAGLLLQQEAEQMGSSLIDYVVYDISFYDDDSIIEPKGQVDITIEPRCETSLACASNQDTLVRVFHQREDNVLEDTSGEVQINDRDGIEKLALSSDSFSPFPVASFGTQVQGAVIEENSINSQIQTQAAALLGSQKNQDDSLMVDKTASYDNTKDQATISLEAYATGQVTQVLNKIPTDIVLVLDESGSMAEKITNTVYTAVTNVQEGDYQSGKEYYISINGTYKRVYQRWFYEDGDWHLHWYYDSKNKTTYWSDYFQSYWNDEDDTVVYPYTTAEGRSDGKTRAYQFYTMSTTEIVKLKALQDAVNAFIATVKEDAISRGVNNRIAIVGFAGWYDPNTYVNDELFIGSTAYGYKDTAMESQYDNTGRYSGKQVSGIAAQYRNALQNVSVNGNINSNLTASVDALTAYGATNAHDGMDMANEIFKANSTSYGTDTNGNPIRNKAVIMFTDGVPTGINSGNSFDSSVANNAIANAKIAKQTYKATVYAAGIVDELDPTKDPTSNQTGKMNRYMQYLSSNYPNASSLTNSGTGGDYKAGYFLSATDAASLTELFQNISGSIGSSNSTLGTSAVLKDYIADSFDTTSLNSGDVKVYTSAYLGNGQWGSKTALPNAQIAIDQTAKTVSVSNYDYSRNYILEQDPVTERPRGSKLIVEITVPAIAGFIGGNEVPTNTSDAGIYLTGSLVKAFPEPSVDVNLEYDYETRDVSIYVADSWEDVMRFFDDPSQTGIQYQLGGQWYATDGRRNAYCNISYAVRDSKGNVLGTYDILAGETMGTWNRLEWKDTADFLTDQKYVITATIEPTVPKSNGAQNLYLSGKEALLHVFCPQIAVTDTRVFYGDVTSLQERITQPVTWKCQDAAAAKPVGAEPQLQYQYTPAGENSAISGDTTQYYPTDDTDLKLSVWKKGVDITKAAVISNEGGGRDEKHDFTIYVDKGTLVITKNIDAQYTSVEAVNANQTFIYKICQYDVNADGSKGELIHTFYETLSFAANEGDKSKSCAVIRGLARGYYEVTEETQWSQKYQLTVTRDNYDNPSDGAVYINADGIVDATVAFTNQINQSWKWMSDVAAVVNRFVK